MTVSEVGSSHISKISCLNLFKFARGFSAIVEITTKSAPPLLPPAYQFRNFRGSSPSPEVSNVDHPS